MEKKTRYYKLRSGIACLMTAFTVFSATSCGGTPPPAEGYEVWGAPATEKILRDHDYEALKSDAKMEIDTARNEYESAQIVISAIGDVKSYTVTLSDLTMVNGDGTYAKENITVYNQKYSNVAAIWSPDAVTGWYPDCLLPFDAAVEAKENKVNGGDNQGLWFSFNTPEDQPVGTYTGNVTLTVDGEENIIPVSLRVRNLTVSEEMHQVSMFINNWSQYLGEYGETQEMTEAYIKKMYEYRISPTRLVMETNNKQEDFEYYAEKAYELCSVPGSGTFGIPTAKSKSGVKEGVLSGYLRELVKKSLEKQYNLIAKAYVYAVDEPVSNNALENSINFNITFKAQVKEVVDEFTSGKSTYMSEYNVTSAFYDEVVASVAGLRHVTTTAYHEAYVDCVDIWCPPFHNFESGYLTGKYDNEDELWWYGAVSPKSPYPTYHLDDDMLAPRMIGWMQNIYGVKGSIYWAVNVYAKYNGSYQYVDEYYEDPAHYRRANGDGFLFYPGKKYGIDGPLPSIRLESIRDGYEEYELLYAIDEAYARSSEIAQAGKTFSATETIKDIASKLYSGMHVTATTETFAVAKKQLLNLSEFTRSGICFTDYQDNGEGNVKYELYVPDTATLEVNGATKTNERAVTAGKMVTYEADMKANDAADEVVFATTVDGVQVFVERQLTSKVSVVAADNIKSSLVSGIVAAETTVVDGLELTGESGNLLRLSLPATTEGAQIVQFENVSIFDEVDANAEKLVFRFWYDGEEDVTLAVKVRYTNRPKLTPIATVTLKKGWNVIEWTGLSAINWTNNGKVQYIQLSFGENGEAARSDIYLKGVSVYRMKGGA